MSWISSRNGSRSHPNDSEFEFMFFTWALTCISRKDRVSNRTDGPWPFHLHRWEPVLLGRSDLANGKRPKRLHVDASWNRGWSELGNGSSSSKWIPHRLFELTSSNAGTTESQNHKPCKNILCLPLNEFSVLSRKIFSMILRLIHQSLKLHPTISNH